MDGIIALVLYNTLGGRPILTVPFQHVSTSYPQEIAQQVGQRLYLSNGGHYGHLNLHNVNVYYSRANEIVLVAIYENECDPFVVSRGTELAKSALLDYFSGKIGEITVANIGKFQAHLQILLYKSFMQFGIGSGKFDFNTSQIVPDLPSEAVNDLNMRSTNDVTNPTYMTTIMDVFRQTASKVDLTTEMLSQMKVSVQTVNSYPSVALNRVLCSSLKEEISDASVEEAKKVLFPPFLLASLRDDYEVSRASSIQAARHLTDLAITTDLLREEMERKKWEPAEEALSTREDYTLEEIERLSTEAKAPKEPVVPHLPIHVRLAAQLSEVVTITGVSSSSTPVIAGSRTVVAASAGESDAVEILEAVENEAYLIQGSLKLKYMLQLPPSKENEKLANSSTTDGEIDFFGANPFAQAAGASGDPVSAELDPEDPYFGEKYLRKNGLPPLPFLLSLRSLSSLSELRISCSGKSDEYVRLPPAPSVSSSGIEAENDDFLTVISLELPERSASEIDQVYSSPGIAFELCTLHYTLRTASGVRAGDSMQPRSGSDVYRSTSIRSVDSVSSVDVKAMTRDSALLRSRDRLSFNPGILRCSAFARNAFLPLDSGSSSSDSDNNSENAVSHRFVDVIMRAAFASGMPQATQVSFLVQLADPAQLAPLELGAGHPTLEKAIGKPTVNLLGPKHQLLWALREEEGDLCAGVLAAPGANAEFRTRVAVSSGVVLRESEESVASRSEPHAVGVQARFIVPDGDFAGVLPQVASQAVLEMDSQLVTYDSKKKCSFSVDIDSVLFKSNSQVRAKFLPLPGL